MDDKSINLWRQIECARRIGKRRVTDRTKPGPIAPRQVANDLA